MLQRLWSLLLLPALASAGPKVDAGRAARLVYPAPESPPAICTVDDLRCLLSTRFAKNPTAQGVVLELYDQYGDVVGVEEDHFMNGGFRGTLHIVPAWPMGPGDLKHLQWVLGLRRELTAFEAAMNAKSAAPIRYRHRAIAWKFLRSVKRRTPSAYASNWEVGYNLDGSLNTSQTAVRDLLVHEIFHLNDQTHDGWSLRTLAPIVTSIFARCKTDVACLTPYAPTTLKVRGGTYYAFQPNNGNMASEYAAELATRFFLEQRAAMRSERFAPRPFKCMTPENARAWRALSDEFFGGVDLTPECK